MLLVDDEQRALRRRKTPGRRGGESGDEGAKRAVLAPHLGSGRDRQGRSNLLLPKIREPLPRLGRRAAQRVRPATQQNYTSSLEGLCQHRGGCAKVNGHYQLPVWRAISWDPVLVDLLETTYDLGRT